MCQSIPEAQRHFGVVGAMVLWPIIIYGCSEPLLHQASFLAWRSFLSFLLPFSIRNRCPVNDEKQESLFSSWQYFHSD
jgi:hypothetical protein